MKKGFIFSLMILVSSQFSFAQSETEKMTHERISFIANMPKDLQKKQKSG